MRKVQRPACPPSLDGPDSTGGQERAEAVSIFSDPANGQESFSFTAYKGSDVKTALEDVFHKKCAYCEAPYGVTAPVDIEHYRPKAAVTWHSGQSTKPGYYWLASTWENLLPACRYCNSLHVQELEHGSRRTVGKGNKFPLRDEGVRAVAPGEESREEPLLLDPCEPGVDPSDHLEFLEGGIVRAAEIGGTPSDRGTATIETVGLKRRGLSDARWKQQIMIASFMELLRSLIEAIDKGTADVQNVQTVRNGLAQLRAFCADDAAFATMSRRQIEPFLDAFGLTLGS